MLSIKQLLAGVLIIIVLGVGAFMYRNAMERPLVPGGAVACTEEAKICPDGTGVGRQGPSCEFAACPPPNVEIADAGVAFALPVGYTQILAGAANQETLRIYQKPSLSPSVQHTISVKRYAIPAGKTADEVILANTRYQPSDMDAENFSRFKTVTLGGRQFRTTVIERFEAIVQSSYFVVSGNTVLRFDIVEHDVTDWMEPNLVVGELPEHAALERMLGTLQIAS